MTGKIVIVAGRGVGQAVPLPGQSLLVSNYPPGLSDQPALRETPSKQ